VIACLTGLATFLGIVRESSTSQALGLYSFSRPELSHHQVYLGVGSLIGSTWKLLLALVIGRSIYALGRRTSTLLPIRVLSKVKMLTESRSFF
jgi:hypothetical protein